jgi:hypothetical protein
MIPSGGADSKRDLRLERPSLRPPLLLSVLPIWRVHPCLPGAPRASAAISRAALIARRAKVALFRDRVA